MNKSEILIKIDEKIKKLYDEINEPNKEIEFYSNFLFKNNFKNIEDLIEVDLADLIIASYHVNSGNIPLEEIQEKIEPLRFLIDNISPVATKNIGMLVKKLSDEEEQEKTRNIVEKIFQKHMKRSFRDDETINNLLYLFTKNKEAFIGTWSLIYAIKLMQQSQEQALRDLYLIEKEGIYDLGGKKTKNRIVNKRLKDDYKIDEIEKFINCILEYSSTIQSAYKTKMRQKKKILSNYNRFKVLFEKKQKSNQITNIRELFDCIEDEELRLEVLKYIYKYNQPYQQQTQTTLEHLSQNSVINYQALLKKYGINQDQYDIEDIMKNELNVVTEMLKILEHMHLKTPQILLYALKISDIDTLNSLYDLFQKNLVSKELIESYPTLLNKETKEYKNLIKNIEKIKEKKINPNYFDKDLESLLIETEKFTANIEVLETYQLLKSIKTTKNHNFLGLENLESIIDEILELGYEQILEKDLSLLDHSKEKWQRIRVLKELNVEVEEENLEQVLTTTQFIIADEELENYIHNVVPYRITTKIENLQEEKQSNIDELNEYTDTRRTYKVNGVILSQNRVKRNLAKLNGIDMTKEEKILVALISGASLNDSEYQALSGYKEKLTL